MEGAGLRDYTPGLNRRRVAASHDVIQGVVDTPISYTRGVKVREKCTFMI